MFPNYNASQLVKILEAETNPPAFLDSQTYLNDFKNNNTLRWRVNPYLYKKENISVLLNDKDYNRWRYLKALNWMLLLVMLAYILAFREYSLVIFLFVYRIAVILIIEHWLFITVSLLAVGLSFLFNFHSVNFWFILFASTLGFILNKFIDDIVSQVVFEKAFTNVYSFWKFYTHKLILIDPTTVNRSFQKLLTKHPELRE